MNEQQTTESTKKRPRSNRNRYLAANNHKPTLSHSQVGTRFGSDTMAPPGAPQLRPQAQPSNDTLSGGHGRGTEADLQHPSPARSTSQSQAQVQPKLRISTNQHQPSSDFENRARPTSAAQLPMVKSPVQTPLAPSFSSVKFTKIGQQPELLKRFSDFVPDSSAIYGFSHDDHRSASPESSMSVAASGTAPRLGHRLLGRPSLLQALGGSDVDVDADMDVDPYLSSTNPAAHPSGATDSHSQVSRTKSTAAGQRPARSGSQSRKSSSDNSNSKGHSAINVITNLSNNANPNNLTLSVNGNGDEYAKSSPQRDSLAPTPDLLYPFSSGPASGVSDNNGNVYNTHTSHTRIFTTPVPGAGPSNFAASSGIGVSNAGGPSSMSNLLALRNLLAEKTARLKARADRERERDATNGSEKDSGSNAESGSGLPSNGPVSAPGQDTHMQGQNSPSDTHPESNAHTEPSSDSFTNHHSAIVSEPPTAPDQQRDTQSPHLDVPSQVQPLAHFTHSGVSPRSHTTPTLSPNIIAGEDTATSSISQPEASSSTTNALSQIPHDALDSALSTAKQWLDGMARARSEIQALLARATVAESASQSLRSELAVSQSESASLREQVSSSSVLLSQMKTEKMQLQTRVRTLETEIECLRARQEEERKERELARHEIEEAVSVGKGIMEWVDEWDKERKDQQEPQDQKKDVEVWEEESETIVKTGTETEFQVHADRQKEQEEKRQLEAQDRLQREQELLKQREQEEADAASFSKKRAQVMKDKERATRETAVRIRAARDSRPISGGVMLSTSTSMNANATQPNDGNNTGGDVHMSEDDVPSVPASATAPSTSVKSEITPPPSLNSEVKQVKEEVKEEEENPEVKMEVKMEDEDADPAPVEPRVSEPPARLEPSLPHTVQPQVASEIPIPSSRRSSSSPHNREGTPIPILCEPRPSGPLPPVVPAHGPVASMPTPMLPQIGSSSGLSSAPQHGQHTRGHVRAQTPERAINLMYEHNQRPHSPPRSMARRQSDHYSPPPVRQLIPPPAMLHRRVSDHYSPPPTNLPSRAQHYSPPPSPPSAGPSARMAWSRKRARAKTDSYTRDEEPPARRPWQSDADRGYERPTFTRHEYADDTSNGPRTPPRPASWEHAFQAEPQLQYDPQRRCRSPSPALQGGRTVWIGNGQSYRPAYDSQPPPFYEAPGNAHPHYPEHQNREPQNAAPVPDTRKSYAGLTVSDTLSSRMGIDHPQGSFETIQPPSSPQQENPNLTLLDRISRKQRPLPSGSSFHSQNQGYSQIQSNGNNDQSQTSNQVRGGPQRGQHRGVRQPRGRGGGRGGSAEYPNSERQSLAARLSGGSTLQDRLS
ncbi:hypothetical protein PILCRDRAFT_435070 [Piloderma croceum F 1598]|uniref:Uncharacterized protein n=1 Tax=Piloderma croceum (strain F 1598) TaxID=765440 RepID=A0A0C3C0U7_PILCF|nr:hypothetical protein PILCRDRAFT_435070 [Piloderma croceum F 1598]